MNFKEREEQISHNLTELGKQIEVLETQQYKLRWELNELNEQRREAVKDEIIRNVKENGICVINRNPDLEDGATLSIVTNASPNKFAIYEFNADIEKEHCVGQFIGVSFSNSDGLLGNLDFEGIAFSDDGIAIVPVKSEQERTFIIEQIALSLTAAAAIVNFVNKKAK